MAFPYNFQCNQPALAARIASIKTTDIEVIFKECFGVVANIMQKFPKPPKCKAAEYIIDNAPQMVLQEVIARHLRNMEQAAETANRGRPINKYHHDPNAGIRRAPQVQIEAVPEVNEEQEEQALQDAVQEALQTPSQVPVADDARIREIAGALDRAQDATIMQRVSSHIREAEQRIRESMVTRIEIVQEVNGETQTRDLGMQHRQFPTLLDFLRARFPVWLPGPAGSGKTTAAMNCARALDLPFHFNGAVDTEYKLLGFTDAGGRFHETPFYRAYKNGGIYLFDEVDASNPQAMVALNAALENGHCVFGNGECVDAHANLYVIAAANTFGAGATHEYVGRNKLDAATVDRFVMLEWGYDEALERAIANNDEWVDYVQRVRSAVAGAGIKHVVSPRASIRGAKLLAQGIARDTVIAATIRKGLSSDQWNSIAARMR